MKNYPRHGLRHLNNFYNKYEKMFKRIGTFFLVIGVIVVIVLFGIWQFLIGIAFFIGMIIDLIGIFSGIYLILWIIRGNTPFGFMEDFLQKKAGMIHA